MAARRLLIVMVILLVISTVVAALAPRPVDDGEEENGEPAEQERPLDDPGWRQGTPGDAEIRSIEIRSGGRPVVIEAHRDEQLELHVWDNRRRVVAIPELGRMESAGRASPARFDLLMSRPGRYEVIAIEPDELVATIVTRP